MTLDELDKLIEKLDSMSYVYHDMTFWHILGMRDVLKELRKDPNTAETMNLSYLKEHLQSRFPDETF
jgi:hypothetical protein